MSMLVMCIRKVLMVVGQRLVPMAVGMRFGGSEALASMLMMRVVHMPVSMFDHFVRVLVPVSLAHMQPDTPTHQQARQKQRTSHRLAQPEQRQERTEKRRD